VARPDFLAVRYPHPFLFVIIRPLDNDSDDTPNELIISSVTLPGTGSVGRDPVSVFYTPPGQLVAPDRPVNVSFAYVVRDGRGVTASADITITLVPRCLGFQCTPFPSAGSCNLTSPAPSCSCNTTNGLAPVTGLPDPFIPGGTIQACAFANFQSGFTSQLVRGTAGTRVALRYRVGNPARCLPRSVRVVQSLPVGVTATLTAASACSNATAVALTTTTATAGTESCSSSTYTLAYTLPTVRGCYNLTIAATDTRSRMNLRLLVA
jgi:hypothetical protein